MARKPYLRRKKAPTSREEHSFKSRPSLVSELALRVAQGRLAEEQAADILCVDDMDAFLEYCIKWKIVQ